MSPRFIGLALGVLATSVISSTSLAQQSPATSRAMSIADAAQDNSAIDQQDDIKKRKLEIGMILTSGVLILGIFLIAMILLYGRRLRRQLALGREPTQPRDELWYLKNPVESETPPPRQDSQS